jgi:hypothetical protein
MAAIKLARTHIVELPKIDAHQYKQWKNQQQ